MVAAVRACLAAGVAAARARGPVHRGIFGRDLATASGAAAQDCTWIVRPCVPRGLRRAVCGPLADARGGDPTGGARFRRPAPAGLVLRRHADPGCRRRPHHRDLECTPKAAGRDAGQAARRLACAAYRPARSVRPARAAVARGIHAADRGWRQRRRPALVRLPPEPACERRRSPARRLDYAASLHGQTADHACGRGHHRSASAGEESRRRIHGPRQEHADRPGRRCRHAGPDPRRPWRGGIVATA